MLTNAKTLQRYTLNSLDGEIGTVSEFYFDDRHWTIRYLVADTGSWLTDRQVLISPYALAAVNKNDRSITIALTKKQIENGPSLDSDTPVSRQFEEAYYGYYGWPAYWSGAYIWGYYPHIERGRKNWRASAQNMDPWDPHLRSVRDVSGYHIHSIDGEIGHVEDFVIDDSTWTIRYFAIDTQNWWPGKKVLISPKSIERVSWRESNVFVNLSRETVKLSPEYSEESLLTRDYDTGQHRHYHRQGYWVEPAGNSLPME